MRKLSARTGPLGTPRRPPGPRYWPVCMGLGAGQPGGPTDQDQPEDASPPPSETREAQGLLTAREDSPRKADRGNLGVCSGRVFVTCSPTHCVGVGCWFPPGGRRKIGFQQLTQTPRSCSRMSTAGAGRPLTGSLISLINGPLHTYSRTPCSAASSAWLFSDLWLTLVSMLLSSPT